MTVPVPTNVETMSVFQHFIDVALCPSKASAAVKKHQSPIFNKGDFQAKTISKTILAPCYFSIGAMPIAITYPFFPSTPKKTNPPHKNPENTPTVYLKQWNC